MANLELAALTELRSRLTELAGLGDALFAAIEQDDFAGAVFSVHRARAVRAAMASFPDLATVPDDAAGVALLADVQSLVARTQPCEQATRRWLSRAVEPDAELLNRPGGPLCIADIMLPEVWDVRCDAALLYGPALGAVAEALIALGQRRIIAFSPEGTPDYPAGVIVATSLDEVVRAVRTFDPNAPKRLATRGLPGEALAGITPRDVLEIIQNTLGEMRVHRNTVTAFSPTWIAQGATNLHHVASWPSIAAADGAFVGVPMIIVAPGPSLAKNVALLREAKGRAIITAFSHTMKALTAAGVVPDLVLTVDPQDVRYHFAGCDVSKVAAVVNGVTVQPGLFELGAPRYLTLAANSVLDDWVYAGFGEQARASGGGSVATTALSLALRWRCDPILMVGLDLSFSGGQYYVGTSCDGGVRASVGDDGVVEVRGWSDGFHRMKQGGGPGVPRERAVTLPGWHGGTVPSSFMFSMFHRWFVETAREATANRPVRIVNCTEGGAYIDGMQHVPLAEELAKLHLPVDVAATLDGVIAGVDVPRRRDLLRRRLHEMRRGTGRCIQLAGRCRRLSAPAASDARAARALAQSERALVRALQPVLFLSLLAQRELESAFEQAGADDRSAEAYLAASARLFDVVGETGRFVAPLLDAAIAALKT